MNSLIFLFVLITTFVVAHYTKNNEHFVPHPIRISSPFTEPYYSPLDYLYPWDNLSHRRDMIYDIRGYPYITPLVEYEWNNPDI